MQRALHPHSKDRRRRPLNRIDWPPALSLLSDDIQNQAQQLQAETTAVRPTWTERSIHQRLKRLLALLLRTLRPLLHRSELERGTEFTARTFRKQVTPKQRQVLKINLGQTGEVIVWGELDQRPRIEVMDILQRARPSQSVRWEDAIVASGLGGKHPRWPDIRFDHLYELCRLQHIRALSY